jgi:hypothetical protein
VLLTPAKPLAISTAAPLALLENTNPAVLNVVLQLLATEQLELPVQHLREFVADVVSPESVTVAVEPLEAEGLKR